MVDTKELRIKIDESGLKIGAIADKLQITRETFYNRMKSRDFKVSEAKTLTDILGLSEEERDSIFFSQKI